METQINIKPSRKDGVGLLLILLLIGSNILVPIFLHLINVDPQQLDNASSYIFTSFFYVILIVIVWLERNNLDDFHLDRWSLFLIALSGTIIHRKLGIPGELGYQIILWMCSGGIVLMLIYNRSKIPITNMRWTFIGLWASLLILIPLSLVEFFFPQFSIANAWNPINNLLSETTRIFVYQLSYVSPIEETIFRGLLWGYLIRLGWSDKKAFWSQAILFWLMHLPRIEYPITFFFTIPVTTLFYSYLARHTRQLFPSIIAHTFINTLFPSMIYLFMLL